MTPGQIPRGQFGALQEGLRAGWSPARPSEGPTAGAEGEKKDSDVADAEFEMVDEDKKKN